MIGNTRTNVVRVLGVGPGSRTEGDQFALPPRAASRLRLAWAGAGFDGDKSRELGWDERGVRTAIPGDAGAERATRTGLA